MERIKHFLQADKIDNTYSDCKSSIILPTKMHKIVSVMVNVVNGSGFISIYNEKTNEQILNQHLINDDRENYEVKEVPIIVYPDGANLRYVLRLTSTDQTEDCWLKIYFKYVEKQKAK